MSRLLTQLRSSHEQMSPVMRRVAQYVLENPDMVIYHTVTELAEATHSSEGSIIRFCQDLGFSGFQEFKLSLAIETGPQGNRESAPQPLTNGSLMGRLARHAAGTLDETALLYEEGAFREVAGRVAVARRIDVYGVGASGVIAQYFAYKFLRFGLAAYAFADVHLGLMSASSSTAADVAIGISSSGSTLDTLQAIKAAKSAGAFTVAVTNRLKSPLAKVADQSLFASPPESPLTGGDVFAKIGQMLVLEALSQLVIDSNEDLREDIRRTAHVVADRSM